MRHTFKKSERICSSILIDRLFSGGNTAMSVFPLRAISMVEDSIDDTVPSVRLLISVPKRHLRHAIERNRMKRQIREAYRLNKQILTEVAQSKGKNVSLALVCISDTLCTTEKVNRSVVKILTRISEKL